MKTVFDLNNLSVHYGDHVALDEVTLKLGSGNTLALLGPNGAGKSTLSRVLLGQQSPTSGAAKVFDSQPGHSKNKYILGVTPQVLDFPKHVTIKEILLFVLRHYNRPKTDLDPWVEKLGFSHSLNKQSHEMSFGQRRLIAIIIAFLGRPEFVILDEPTVGLDVNIRFKIWEVIRDFQNLGGSLLITTHHLEEAEELSDEIAVLDSGCIIAHDSVDKIKEKFGYKVIRFQSNSTFPSNQSIVKKGDKFEWTSKDTDGALRELVKDPSVYNIEVLPVSLQDAFINILNERSH